MAVNKVVQSNGTTLIDISDTTAVASDVASGKYFYLASGEKVEGTASGGGSVTWETLYSGNATIVSSSPNYISILNFSETIGEGETWRITWDGTPYTCTAVYNSQISGCYVGNAHIVDSGSSDTGEPFWAYKRTSSQLAFSTNDSAGTIALVIERQKDTSATLITKTITANGTYSAEDDDADGYSSVTVNVNQTDSIVVKSRDSDGYPTELDYYNSDGIVPAQTFCNTRSAAASGWCYGKVTKINLKGSNSFKVYGDAFRGMHALTDPDFSKITELANNGSNNTGDQATFRTCAGLLTVNAPNLTGGLPVFCFFDCKKLVSVYLPKINAINGYASNRGSFGNCSALTTCEFGSVGYPITFVHNYAFHSCPAIETMTFYAKSDYVDELLANVRTCVTTGTIIVKASEATTYGGTSYAAGDTIVTSTP